MGTPHPGRAAVLVTDPPYRSLDAEVGRGTTTRLVGGPSRDRDGSVAWFPTLSNEQLASFLREAVAGLRPDGAAYVFGDVKTGLELFPELPVKNVLVWDKQTLGMGYAWRRMHEWIAYCPRDQHQLRERGYGDILRVAGDVPLAVELIGSAGDGGSE